MNATEARTAEDLLTLVATAAPAITAPAGLAETVLRHNDRRSRGLRSRRSRFTAAGVVLAVTGSLAAAALQGRGNYFEYTQPSGAMVPSVAIGQTVLLVKDPKPVRGDVVLLTFQQGFDALSRVIGLPGDTVACPDNGKGGCDAVTVNGAALDETWLQEPTAPFAGVQVEAGEVFVLGDARDAANDSRLVGAQRLSAIKGAAVGLKEDGELVRLPGTPTRPAPNGDDITDPADPVPPASSS